MSTFILKNSSVQTEVAARDISYAVPDPALFNKLSITNNDILGAAAIDTFLYASDDLVFSFLLAGEEPGLSHKFDNYNVKIHALIKDRETTITFGGTEAEKFKVFNLEYDTILSQDSRISIKIKQTSIDRIRSEFSLNGLILPDFGLLAISFNVLNSANVRSVFTTLVKFSILPLFTTLLLTPLAPTPENVSINTFKTSPYTFESLFIPQLSGAMIYNFYEPTEEDYEVYKNRNYAGAKLTDIPKYIKLTWNKPGVYQQPQIIIRQNDLGAGGGIESTPAGSSVAAGDAQNTLLGQIGNQASGLSDASSASAINVGGVTVSLSEENDMSTAIGGAGTRSSGDFRNLYDVDGGVSGLDGTIDDGAVISPSTPGILPGSGIDPGYQASVSEGARDIIPDDEAHLYSKSEYIGYVIQKNRISQEGDVTKVDLIAVNGREISEFIDWKISYGETYQYQIRSIFRFVNKNNINIYFDSDSLLNGAQTNQYIDSSRFSLTSPAYYYDSEFSTLLEFVVQEFERPEPPHGVTIYPNSKAKSLFISWSQKNQDRDVVGYNVYRRKVGEKFIKINSALLGVRDNKYIDFDIEKEQEYIYSIESVDFHGNFSKMSAQFSCKIVSYNNFSNTFCEKKQKLVSSKNLELGEELILEPESGTLIFKKKINLNINPLYNNLYDKDYFVIKATSLDTGLTKQLKINFNSLTIYHVRPYTPEPTPFIYVPVSVEAGALNGLFETGRT